MNERRFEVLLALVISARATSFIFNKLVLREMQPFNMQAVRFTLAALLMALLFFGRLRQIDRRTLRAGAVLGTLYFAEMSCELIALRTATTATVSLLTNCSIILVPLLEALLHRHAPTRSAILCALTAMAGVVCLALERGGFSGSVRMGLLSPVFYASAIIATGHFTREAIDSLCVGIVQNAAIALLATAASFFFETPQLPPNADVWKMFAVLVIVGTGFGFTLQPVAQRHVSVERAGLMCAISPAVTALLGFFVLHERLGLLGLLGMALILCSIMLPHLGFSFSRE